MKVVIDDFEIDVYCYHCEECEERFYIERLLHPTIVNCPHCGEGDHVSISSGHVKELFKQK